MEQLPGNIFDQACDAKSISDQSDETASKQKCCSALFDVLMMPQDVITPL